ncbi:hypothetical protein [Thermosulfuriphilus sp.]
MFIFRIIPFLVIFFLWSDFCLGGQIRLMPRVFLSEEYNDNIYLSPNQEKSDWITILGPGIRLEQLTQYRSLGFNYELGLSRYKREDRNDSTRHNLSFFWDEQLRERLFMNITESFYRTEQPSEYRYQPDIMAVRHTRKPSYRNTFSGNLAYQFAEKGFLRLSYSDVRFGSSDPDVEDSRLYSPGFSLSYGWGPVHKLTFSFFWSRYEYDTRPGQEGWNPSVSYTYYLNPHASILAQYSYSSMDFKSSSQDDYGTQSLNFSFNQALSDNFNYQVSLGYYLRDREDSGQDSGITYSFNLSRRGEYYQLVFSGSGGYREQYVDAENKGFTRYQRYSISLSVELGPYTTGQASVYYNEQEYKDLRDRTDDFYGFSCSVSRILRPNIVVSLSYSYRIRDAEVPAEEYRENSLVFKITGSYEFRR